jgi:NTE family protein
MSRPTRPPARGNRPRLALVFSGGGARGAYEAGVIKYLREDLAGDLGGHVQFDIICGTSVGAIHACFMAAMCDTPGRQGTHICEKWEALVLEQMVTFGLRDMLRARKTLFGSGAIEEFEPGERRLGGIVQTRLLERTIRRMMAWTGIRKNRDAGRFESLAISATDVGSGKTVVFIESGKPVPPWSIHPYVRAQEVKMGPQHCMASAAIPVLFPAVQVGERFYCDGGLRQNTPLSPALRLGADKVLVVSLKQDQEIAAAEGLPEEAQPYPGAALLAGKILNAFLLDHIDYDLQRMKRLNEIMAAVRIDGGPEFRKKMDEVVTRLRGQPYREVDDLVLVPSQNLGTIAGDIARANKFKGQGGGAGIRALRRLAQGRIPEADLLSYILFDGVYAAELVRIGHEDCRKRHEELCRFLKDCVVREE